ncbi:MAG TPA: AraC family transcriptional regulator ligand-binding domain-containing protein [Xanthobacteraceae bacterium]|nr:AraC family transcriptional regulator ligand-binding domain-containing protein [Xanthobacteraceae bacterium]
MRSFRAIPTAAGAVTRLAHARASEAGIDPKPLLKEAGLREQQIDNRDARLDVRHQIRFLNLAANTLHDQLLGFHLAQPVDLRELGWIYYVAASSELLGEALQRAARYSSMVNEGVSVRYLEGEEIKISVDYVGVARHSDRHQIEFVMTLLIRLCRQLTGRRLVPIRARFIHHRDSGLSELAAFFGGDIEFGATMDEVTFAITTSHLPVVSADPYLNELLIASCEEALSRRPTNRGSFRSQVENAVVPLLPHGRARAGEIARRLRFSQRTFARRLALEGLTFSEVVESLRRELAEQYLADSGLSISKIAWLLGYRENSAFAHAFKRWTGKTPRQARAQQGSAQRGKT